VGRKPLYHSLPPFPASGKLLRSSGGGGGALVGSWVSGGGGAVLTVGTTVGLGPVPPPSACLTAFIRGYLKQHNNELQFTLHFTLRCIVRFIQFSIGKKMAAVHSPQYLANRRGVLTVSAFASGTSCSRSSPGRGLCCVLGQDA